MLGIRIDAQKKCQFRQGDLFLRPIRTLTPDEIKRENPDPVIAIGEGTKHKHRIREEDQGKVRRVEAEVEGDFLEAIIVSHQEDDSDEEKGVVILHDGPEGNHETMPDEFHAPAVLEPGTTYQIIRQKEADPLAVFNWRPVVD